MNPFRMNQPLMQIFVLFLCLSGLLWMPDAVQAQTADERVQTAVQAVERLAQSEIDQKAIVGAAIAIVHNDKVIYAKGFGEREIGKGAKVDADTVFQLASVSKPIGATVVAGLIGNGKITWDSKITDLDPNFEMFDPWVTREVTIRDMYVHRSGLPEHAGDLLEDLGYDREQVLHRLRYQKPDSSFRSTNAYTNFGLTAAAVAAAKAYGMNWEDASAEKLYKPLGMRSTSSRYSDYEGRANKAMPHVVVDGKWVQKYKRDPDAQSPAGGVSSSANDLAQWMRLRLANGKFDGKQVVDEKALLETQHPLMLTRFSPLNGLPGFYGLGMNVNYDERGRLRLGHSGAFALGVGTNISMVPSENLGIVVLTNSYPVGVAEGLAAAFTDLALDGKQSHDWLALFKKVFSDPAALGLNKGFDYSKSPPAKTAPLSNAAYVGAYSNHLFGDIDIREKNGALELVMGPKPLIMALKHYDRDTFVFEPIGENAAGLSGVVFHIGPNGKATDIVIEHLDENSQGLFIRKK